MKKFFLAIALLMAVPCFAQKVGGDPKNNIVHVVDMSSKSGKLVNSGHSLKDKQGNVYIVYINSNNKLVYQVPSKKYPGKFNTYHVKGKKWAETQYKDIVADLKRQGITVE